MEGRRLLRLLRVLPWVSAVSAVTVAALLVAHQQREDRLFREQIDEQHRLKLAGLRQQVEEYLDEIRLCLRVVAVHPDVKQLRATSYEFLQALYEANFEQHQLSEIYVIERGFDGTRPPLMRFERGDESHDAEELHTPEREAEEYIVQMDHIRRFADDPALDSIVSQAVGLCIGQPGLVFSLPIRSGNDLMGIVAGMIPSKRIVDILANGAGGDHAFLLHGGKTCFGCSSLAPSVNDWLKQQLRSSNDRDFFGAWGGCPTCGRFRGAVDAGERSRRRHVVPVLGLPPSFNTRRVDRWCDRWSGCGRCRAAARRYGLGPGQSHLNRFVDSLGGGVGLEDEFLEGWSPVGGR
jgi:hypothetical protein